jgi:hypothetical protein
MCARWQSTHITIFGLGSITRASDGDLEERAVCHRYIKTFATVFG